MDVTIFPSAADFRRWLEENQATASELWVGYHKKGSDKVSISYREAVDEALCFGWIDGIARRIDDESYANRYTPRKRRSNWSAANVTRVAELTREGRMHPAGLAAFEVRTENRTGIYSYENRPRELEPEQARLFRANPDAWAHWQAETPSYRRAAIWWVVSAKQEATRQRRLATLIDDSAHGRRIASMQPRARIGTRNGGR